MQIDHKEPRLLGESAHIRAIHREIETAARSDAKVLITGETGVGKDVVARLIHQASARSAAPLATLNCAGVPDSLMESELFGHVRGSFTGAYRDKPGILEAAAHGTVFLDEVGEMSLRMQAALLRFLETGEIQRVGADRVRGDRQRSRHRRYESRARSRDRGRRLSAGSVLSTERPPHRSPAAARAKGGHSPSAGSLHGRAAAGSPARRQRRLSAEALALLVAYSWPGNIRQLKNVVERLAFSRAARQSSHTICRQSCGPRHASTHQAATIRAKCPTAGRRGRTAVAHASRRRVVLVRGPRSFHESRPLPCAYQEHRGPRTSTDRRQLPHGRPALQHAGRPLQTVSRLSPEAPMPGAVSIISRSEPRHGPRRVRTSVNLGKYGSGPPSVGRL